MKINNVKEYDLALEEVDLLMEKFDEEDMLDKEDTERLLDLVNDIELWEETNEISRWNKDLASDEN